MIYSMPVYLYVFVALSSLTQLEIPAGTRLHVRIATPVGTYASAAGSPVSAFLIAPVNVNGATVLPAGATLTGEVTSVRRVGMGFVHETSAMNLEFNRITFPGGPEMPLSARIAQVDNSRETVSRKGLIQGVRSTGTLPYRVCGYIKTALLWEFHAQLAFWAIKTLVVQLPEPELYYPPGAEFTLVSTAPMRLSVPDQPEDKRTLSGEDTGDVERLVAGMPTRAVAPVSQRPSDLINTALIGSRDQIAAAFEAAGWTQARPATLRCRIFGVTQLAQGRGFHALPMSPQLVNNAEADMSWQKDLNDLSKRHHIRVWKQPGAWHGQDIWIGAATRDVDLAYLRPGQALTHRIAENVDEEREKVVDDLAFTSCVDRVGWFERQGLPRSTRNATGDLMFTDGRMAVIQLNDCRNPKLSTQTLGDAPRIAMHGNRWHRFVRREILSMRSDLIRANLYWRTFEGMRYAVSAVRKRNRQLEAGTLRSARSSS